MCENHLLERTWCPSCKGHGFELPQFDLAPLKNMKDSRIHALGDCNFCQGTGRVWSQDARAWIARQQSIKEVVASDK